MRIFQYKTQKSILFHDTHAFIETSNKRETRKGTQFLLGFASFPSSSNASNAIQITQRKRTTENAYLPIAGQIPNNDSKQKTVETNTRTLRILLPNHSNGFSFENFLFLHMVHSKFHKLKNQLLIAICSLPYL